MRRNPLFPWYVWLNGGFFALICALQSNHLSQPDDLAAWWIGAHIAGTGDLSHLYAIDPNDFGRYVGPVWSEQAELIADSSPYAHPYVHIPLVALLLAGVSNLMDFQGFVTWSAIISGFSFSLIAASAISLWTRRAAPPLYLVGATTAIYLSAAGQSSLWLGQTSPLIYALVGVGLAASARRPIIAGIALAVASIIKITPVVLIIAMLAISHRRRAGSVALASTLMMVAISWVWAGGNTMKTWWDTVMWMSGATLLGPANASLKSLGLSPSDRNAYMATSETTNPAAVAWTVGILVVLTLGLLMLAATRTTHLFEITAVVILGASTALNSAVWVHYGLVAAFAIAGIFCVGAPQLKALTPLLMLVAYEPFGKTYHPEISPWGQQWAPLVLIIAPTIMLLLGHVWVAARRSGVSVNNLRANVREQVLGRRARLDVGRLPTPTLTSAAR